MAEERVSLKSYIVNLAYGLKPMATLKIEINGKEYEESSSGDGQYDAFVRALRKIYKVTLGRKFPMLTNYAVTIPPGGRTDAFLQTVITWSFEDTRPHPTRRSTNAERGCKQKASLHTTHSIHKDASQKTISFSP